MSSQLAETAHHRTGDRVLDGRGDGGRLQVHRVEQCLFIVEQIEQRVVGQGKTGGPCGSTSGLGELIEGRGRGGYWCVGVGGVGRVRGRVPFEFIVDNRAQVVVEKVVAIALYRRRGPHAGGGRRMVVGVEWVAYKNRWTLSLLWTPLQLL